MSDFLDMYNVPSSHPPLFLLSGHLMPQCLALYVAKRCGTLPSVVMIAMSHAPLVSLHCCKSGSAMSVLAVIYQALTCQQQTALPRYIKCQQLIY